MVFSALRAAARIASVLRIAFEATARGRRTSGPGAARARAEGFAEASRAALRALGIEVEVDGTPPESGVLLASNHLSYVDPVAIAAVVPCVPISKADLASWPVFGAVAKANGVLMVERGEVSSGMRVMRSAQTALEGGLPVLNFAEGTTTRGDRVLPLRRGLFGVARRAGGDVVPVALSYDPPDIAWVGDATFVPHFLLLAARKRSRVRVRFGAPLASRSFESAAELADAVHARISSLLEDRTPWRKTQP
jgi:1-acyl-sn-glycerol-3-phosphate acyltransferase